MFASFLLPLLLLAVALWKMRSSKHTQRRQTLSELGFLTLDSEEMERLGAPLTQGGAAAPIAMGRIKEAYRGEFWGVPCHLLFLDEPETEYATRIGLCSIPVARAPGTVRLAPSTLGVHRFSQLPKHRVGSKNFNRKWQAHGAPESARFLVTETFEAELMDRNRVVPSPLVIWHEDRFYYGFRGTPTGAGIRYMLEQAIALSQAAGILETEP